MSDYIPTAILTETKKRCVMDDPYVKFVTKDLLSALRVVSQFLDRHHFTNVHVNHDGTARFFGASADDDDMLLTPAVRHMLWHEMNRVDTVYTHTEAPPVTFACHECGGTFRGLPIEGAVLTCGPCHRRTRAAETETPLVTLACTGCGTSFRWFLREVAEREGMCPVCYLRSKTDTEEKPCQNHIK